MKAMAQDDPQNTVINTLDLEQADVRDALRALFNNVKVGYVVANDVQGVVTVNLKNVTFGVALQNILKQVDATFRLEGGIYQIVKREKVVVDNGTPDTPQTVPSNKIMVRIHIRHADPAFIFMMLNGRVNTGISPEISSLTNGGFGRQGGGQGGGGFGGGGGGLGGGGGGLGGGGMGGGFGGGGGGGLGGGGGGFGGGGLGGGGGGMGGGGFGR
jgi:hypothetical protein